MTAFYFRGGKSIVEDIKGSRKSVGNSQPSVLILIMFVLAVINFIFLTLTAFDIRLFGSLLKSMPVILVSCILLLIVNVMLNLTRFFYLGKNWSANIIVSKDQEIIAGGPYRIIRHPLYLLSFLSYSCFIISFCSIPVIITSFLIMSSYVLLAITEDDILCRELPGYESYKKTVKYKMIPFVW
jgi:protein-S-isoprenylcysteine O-methyltransferase Ste14